MPALHLLRHAKSSWGDFGLRDHDRPLSERGMRSASAMSVYLRKIGVAPDLVLCSSARRTVDTLAALRSGLPQHLPVETSDELYEVDAQTLLERLRELPDAVGTLLLIGHNPGLGDLATQLAGPGSDPVACRALDRKFSTGALATIEFDGAWSGVCREAARLIRFIAPRDLV